MNGYFMGPTFITLAVLAIGAVYANLWARRVREFLPVARNRGRLVDLAKRIASESVGEMLMAMPGGSTASLSDTADVPAQHGSRTPLGPFGDW